MSTNSIEQLIDRLAVPLAAEKERAQRDLLALGEDAIPRLVRALGDERRPVRVGTMLTLGLMRATAALPALQLIADHDPDPTLHPMALRAISDIVDESAGDDVKAFLIRKLRDEDRFVRGLACRGLGQIGDAAARKALQLSLDDAESWVRDAAKQAMVVARAKSGEGAQGNESGALVRAADAAVATQLRGLLSLDPKVQRRAVEKLGAIGDDAAVHVAPLLYDELKSTRRAAVEALGAIGSTRAASYLVALLEEEALAPDLRAAALHVLATSPLDPPALGDAARSALRHDDRYVRAAAAACSLRGDQRARADALRAIVDDDDEWVHVTGLRALREVASADDRAHQDLLIEALARVADPVAQAHLLLALRQIFVPPRAGDPLLTGSLAYFLESENDLVQEAALLLFIETATHASPGLLACIREALRDAPDRAPIVAETLARIARLNDESTLDLLERLLDDTDATTMEHAARGIDRVGTRRAIELLVSAANAGGPRGDAASHALASRPGDAELTTSRDEAGVWKVELVPRCTECRAPLDWREAGEREELRCPDCDAEYVLLGAGPRALPVDRVPFGLCLCCKRKNVLIRGGRGEQLECPITGEVHIRPHDLPHQIHLLRDLPLGACSCCAEPQPLIKVDDEILCRRTRRRHVDSEGSSGYGLPAPRVAVASDIEAINEALLGGTLDIGQSGVPVSQDEDE